MRFFFDPDETDEFEAAKDLLIRRGLVWASSHGLPADAFIWSAALDLRHGSTDGRLTHWTSAEVRRFLLDFIPRQVSAPARQLTGGPAHLATFLSYLDSVGLLDPRGDSLAKMRLSIRAIAFEYAEAIGDPFRWGPAKFWTMTAIAEGVDPTGPGEMGEFIERAQSGRVEFDEETLAHIMDREWSRPPLFTERALPQPPVDLPAPKVLREALMGNSLVTALTGWIGPNGRDLEGADRVLSLPEAREAARLLGTGEADLDVADATGMPELGLLIAWAKKARLIRQSRGRLVQVKKHSALLRDPLALWCRAVDAFAELGEAACVSPWPGESRYDLFADGFADHIPDILNSLYGLPLPAPVPRMLEPIVHALAEHWWADPAGIDDESDQLRPEIQGGLDKALDLLTAHGVLETTEDVPAPLFLADLADNPEMTPEMRHRLRAELSEPCRLIRLTDAGRYAVRKRLLAERRDVPLIGELANASALQLLGTIVDGDYPPPAAFAEIDAWLARDGRAVQDLVTAIAACPFHSRRLSMLSVLTGALPDGGALLDRLCSDPVLAPSAFEELIGREVLTPEDLSEDMATRMLIVSFAMLLETGGLGAVHETLANVPEPDRAELVALVGSSDHLDAVTRAEFLEAAGGA